MTESEIREAMRAVAVVQELEAHAETVADNVMARRSSVLRGWSAVYEPVFTFGDDTFTINFRPNNDDDNGREDVTFPIRYLWLDDEALAAEVQKEVDLEVAKRAEAAKIEKARQEAAKIEHGKEKERQDRAVYERLRARFELTVLSEALDKK